MSAPDSNPDREYDAWVDRQEMRGYRPGWVYVPYTPPPRRRLRYWALTLWRLIVPERLRRG